MLKITQLVYQSYLQNPCSFHYAVMFTPRREKNSVHWELTKDHGAHISSTPASVLSCSLSWPELYPPHPIPGCPRKCEMSWYLHN